jgi:hypothetical protein
MRALVRQLTSESRRNRHDERRNEHMGRDTARRVRFRCSERSGFIMRSRRPVPFALSRFVLRY